jgi:hypothetical protein
MLPHLILKLLYYFRKDVNMSTKTKGQIVEELAVVIRALWAGEYRTVACRDFKVLKFNIQQPKLFYVEL